MVRTSDLVAKAIDSGYSSEKALVYCYKIVGENSFRIPWRFSSRRLSYKHVSFPSLAVSLYPEQKKIVSAMDALCTSQGNVACHPVFCHVYTGAGKTYMGIAFAASKNGPILVLCNSDPIRKGWVKSFKEVLGVSAHIASGPELGKHDVCILSYQLAEKHKYGREAYGYYKTVIVDEADCACTQLMVNEMLDMSPEYFVGMTATVTKLNGLDKVLDIFWGPRKDWIVRLKTFNEECSMVMKILYTSHKVDNIRNRKGKLDWMSMAESVSMISERNILIRNLCILHCRSKILILCKRTEHVKTLLSLLKEAGVDAAGYYGDTESYYDAHVLVATLSKAGRGYDDKQVSSLFDGRRFDVLIVTMTMRNMDQPMGRGLRGNNLLLYLLVDDNSTMKKHADIAKKTNQPRGAKIIEEYV